MKAYQGLILAGCGLLAATLVPAADWPVRSPIKSPAGNLVFATRWVPSEGLRLSITTTNSAAALELQFDRKSGRAQLLAGTNAPAGCFDRAQFMLAALPTNTLGNARALIKFRPETWLIYLEDRLVVSMPTPFPAPALLRQPSNEWPAAAQSTAGFQKTDEFYFHDDFMVPTNSENILAEWEIQSGEWEIHTVQDDALIVKKENKKKSRQPDPERSPNYYSLSGTGHVAIITAGYPFYDHYELEAAMFTTPGEMGLVFYFQDPSNYYAFTVTLDQDYSRPAMLELRQMSARGDSVQRRRLAGATAPVLPNQWVKPRVSIGLNRVQCWLDTTLVFDIPVDLTPGGCGGLLVDSSLPVRFDDVQMQSNRDLDLRDLAHIQLYTLGNRGDFYRTGWLRSKPAPTERFMNPAKSSQPQWLLLGAPSHRGHVFAARFAPGSRTYAVGLISGYTGPDQPYWRFVYERRKTNELFRLERVVKDQATPVETDSRPLASTPPATVALMADATEETSLRFYRNGELALFHQNPAMVGGASGVFLGPFTAASVSDLSYCFSRSNQYRSRFEKNRLFAKDPFMRHWSAPEGEWIAGTNTTMWHKSDFFGRFDLTMPVVTNSEIHLGVEEDRTNGGMVVAITTNSIILIDGARYPDRSAPLGLTPLPENRESLKDSACLIGCEDRWLWVNLGTNELFRHRMAQPFRGTRIRLAGYTQDHLASSLVNRYNVMDYLFTEAPSEWVINGGRWQVVNRFQCDPRWSHMDGESSNSLASLWTKSCFKGDFCIEFYAGIRHGWYDRCGDLNLTMMSPDMFTGSGYTVVCSGWDPDQSQLYSWLYRNGQMRAQSDRYLVPRSREGNVRRSREPIVADGRDVHGAWYYIKFRRIGKKMEYYFDNELVFRADDDAPLPEGRAGIWTFMESMMVARVKIAAREITPGRIAITPAAESRAPDPPAPRSAVGGLILNGRNPLNNLQPAFWSIDDPVGYPHLAWHQDAVVGDYFSAQSLLGGGSLAVGCDLAPVPYAELAGWRFYVKRTERACFNFHFSIGRLDATGEFTSKRRYFHRLTGSDGDKSDFSMVGRTAVPAIATNQAPWHATGVWTPIDVWLPMDKDYIHDTNVMVRVEGFGNLHPGPETQGLAGNGPGQGYAVALFTEVLYRPPQLTVTNQVEPVLYRLHQALDRNKKKPDLSLSDLQAQLLKAGTNGLNYRRITGATSNAVLRLATAWIQAPDSPALSCAWSERGSDIVILKSDAAYPERSLATARLTTDYISIPLEADGFNRLAGVLPRQTNQVIAAAGPRQLFLRYGTNTMTVMLAPRPTDVARDRPLLIKLDGPAPFFENFEKGDFGHFLEVNRDRMFIRHHDPVQGDYLEVGNRNLGQRLRTVFTPRLSLACYPIMQFRYRAEEMTRISLALQNTYYVKLSEEYSAAVKVRHATEFQRDGAWHTWRGQVGDAVGNESFNRRQYLVQSLVFGSCHSTDQTGKYSRWSVDDIVLGPAVNSADQLALTPFFHAATGIKEVALAVRQGEAGYTELDDAQRRALVWRTQPGQTRMVPDLTGLTDGLCHLFLQATDMSGLVSAVTDIPFLLDRKPATASAVFETDANPLSNGLRLRCSFVKDEGAPVVMEGILIKWNDKAVDRNHYISQITTVPTEITMAMNWPYLFRDELDRMNNGDTAQIGIANIRDGASNRTADIVMPLKIDYSTDRTGPSLLQTKYPTNILYVTAWEGLVKPPQYLDCLHGNNTRVVHEFGSDPYLKSEVAEGENHLVLKADGKKWSVTNHPYLALRLRRPVIPTNDHSRSSLVLDMTNKTSWILPLNYSAEGTNYLRLPAPITWNSNRWQTVAVNVRELLREKMKPEDLAAAQISALHLWTTNSMANMALHVQNLFVYSDWPAGGKVTVDAYDASGVAGLAWEYVNDLDQIGAPPGVPNPGGASSGWYVARAKDKAGNLSAPLRTPAPVTVRTDAPNVVVKIEDVFRMAQ